MPSPRNTPRSSIDVTENRSRLQMKKEKKRKIPAFPFLLYKFQVSFVKPESG